MSLAQQEVLAAHSPGHPHPDGDHGAGDESLLERRASIAAENTAWVSALTADRTERDAGVARLYRILVRSGYAEARWRGARFQLSGPELDDIAHQAAADAVMTICRKVDTFRGDSRFTTWARRFVEFEVSSKINRHFWQRSMVSVEDNEWTLPPANAGWAPEEQAEAGDLLHAVLRACAGSLTERQRTVFEAVVVRGTTVSHVAGQLGSTENALYKTMFDARRKLRTALVEGGYLECVEIA
ncbi:sigma-70 family RNA polymerase sigma factor [Kribbella sp. NBC_00889]|uniref:sigma-70 family RNA polymerase sigma factor n=1 Tax=Kribbella sp. NBC_00889 TaxID=2975974 RepID=UPI003863CDBC|nr:sigma-70 family RNA polymerase sigma factor [Kribbella sp. NBC_00889]